MIGVERLRANPSHPTFKKLERIIGLLNICQIEFEWVDGRLKIRDNEYAVNFDIVEKEEGTPLTELPPIFDYKLTRDAVANKYCKCGHCISALEG